MPRSSRPEVFCKKDVLRNFAKFTGKHLYQSLLFNKVAGLRPHACLNTFSYGAPPVATSKCLINIYIVYGLEKQEYTDEQYFYHKFNYCPMISHNRNVSNKIKKPHQRNLLIHYSQKSSKYEELLEKDNSVPKNYWNIQALCHLYLSSS